MFKSATSTTNFEYMESGGYENLRVIPQPILVYSQEIKKLYKSKLLGSTEYSKVYEVMDKQRKIYALKQQYIVSVDEIQELKQNYYQYYQKSSMKYFPQIFKFFIEKGHDGKGIFYILTEKFDTNLEEYILQYQKKLHIAEIDDIIFQALGALVYLEGKGLYHGNLKPRNILLNLEGDRIKKVRVSDRYDPKIFTFYYTNNYSSPEIAQSLLNLQNAKTEEINKSDIFTLGLILLKILCPDIYFGGLNKLQDITLRETRFEENLVMVSSRRGQTYKHLLQYMLQSDPLHRKSAIELFQFFISKKSNYKNLNQSILLQEQSNNHNNNITNINILSSLPKLLTPSLNKLAKVSQNNLSQIYNMNYNNSNGDQQQQSYSQHSQNIQANDQNDKIHLILLNHFKIHGQKPLILNQNQYQVLTGQKRSRLGNSCLEAKIKYSDGIIYEGEIQGLQKDGFGTLFLKNCIIKGLFYKDETMKGQILKNTGEILYEGEMLNYKPNGSGTAFINKTKILQGQFVKGSPTNNCLVIDKNGKSYQDIDEQTKKYVKKMFQEIN